ncbi:MAG: site-2 protease family protein [Capsulimonadaceae bacterium]|nr:site-2 protease family protein [Capsulimonadaceae bacterium]
MDLDVRHLVMVLFSFAIANTLHEFGHALAATALGDDTPRSQGRLTLNPIDHLDPMGTVFLVINALMGGLFGWGKPVAINPAKFKDPRAGDTLVTFAGPFMNLVLACACAFALRANVFHLAQDSPFVNLLSIGLELNLVLFLFNLIPVPPLDGAHILANLLPEKASRSYVDFMNQFGMLALLVVMFGGGYLISGPLGMLSNLLLG